MVLARPPPLFSSPATAHLLPPDPAQSAHRYTCPFSQLVRFLYYRTCPIRPSLADRWAHPVSEPGVVIRTCPFSLLVRFAKLVRGHFARGPSRARSAHSAWAALAYLPKGASSSSLRNPATTLSQSHVTAMWGPPISSIPLPAPANPNPVATSSQS
jgi:hypothetical protein